MLPGPRFFREEYDDWDDSADRVDDYYEYTMDEACHVELFVDGEWAAQRNSLISRGLCCAKV